MSIAVIPARGGSKRIPQKNIKMFAGKPMIAYSILAAIESAVFERILVSTDSLEIANVANQFGAETPFIRPPELSDDYATTSDVMVHASQWIEENNGGVDEICCIYPTAPLIGVSSMCQGRDKIRDGDWNYVFSATKFSYPIHRGLLKQIDGSCKMLFPENLHTRSQDLPEVWHDAGQFYWGRTIAWLEKRPIFSESSSFVELPSYRVQDIDTIDDWTEAEIRFELLKRKELSL